MRPNPIKSFRKVKVDHIHGPTAAKGIVPSCMHLAKRVLVEALERKPCCSDGIVLFSWSQLKSISSDIFQHLHWLWLSTNDSPLKVIQHIDNTVSCMHTSST